MVPFNSNDPKYHSCCCGAHVRTLARVLVVITLVSYILQLFQLSRLGMAGFLITCLGAFAIFQEQRMPMLVFIGLMILHLIVGFIYGANNVLRSEECRELGEKCTPVIIFVFLLAVFITIPFLLAYWNLAEFIKDRETSQQVPVLYEVRIDKPTPTGPSAPVVPSAPPVPSSSDGPPPYSEK
ncbi:hypothetical protein PENTCL1PPCAC_22106 [Pristionchus entomophagus]|uniref:Uncharacterized protein n=1 Tax=Pristionchus entomophagus TaxID=358040 RepID=A0AAV5TZI8_9BILA|nr:hypothetical protein PENTCL1PPCAC_22106 [Pristionchus entomophagus]